MGWRSTTAGKSNIFIGGRGFERIASEKDNDNCVLPSFLSLLNL